MEKELTFRIVEYAKDQEYVTIEEICDILELESNDKDFIRNNLVSFNPQELSANTILASITRHFRDSQSSTDYVDQLQLRIVPNALFSYIDHLEIVEARKATEQAREASNESIRLSNESIKLSNRSVKIAWVAIGISTLVGIAQIVVSLSNWKIFG